MDSHGFKFWQRYEIFIFSKTSKLALRPTKPPIQWYWDSFLRVKCAGREVKLLPPSTAKVKDKQSHTFTPPVSLHGIQTKLFNF